MQHSRDSLLFWDLFWEALSISSPFSVLFPSSCVFVLGTCAASGIFHSKWLVLALTTCPDKLVNLPHHACEIPPGFIWQPQWKIGLRRGISPKFLTPVFWTVAMWKQMQISVGNTPSFTTSAWGFHFLLSCVSFPLSIRDLPLTGYI